VWTPPVGGQAGSGAGSTQLVSTWIVEAQDALVPWQAHPVAEWVARVQRLTYRGTVTTFTAGTPPFQLPIKPVGASSGATHRGPVRPRQRPAMAVPSATGSSLMRPSAPKSRIASNMKRFSKTPNQTNT